MLSTVLAGAFRAVVLRGSPGIGKTGLLAALQDAARRRAMAVHHGQATEFERHVPFAVYAAAFEPPVAATSAPTDDLDGLIATAAGLADGTAAAVDRYHLFQRVRRSLERRAKGTPTLVVLDDLHWADESSLELTEYLMRRPPRAGLMLAVAHRSEHDLPMLTDAAQRLGDAALVLRVSPLTTLDVEELLPDQPRARRRLLHQISAGNPLYLQTLAAASDETLAAVAGRGDDSEPVDRALFDVLRGELDRLSLPSRHVAQAAAVAGDQVGLDLVAWIAGRSDTAVASAVDELCRLEVVTIADSRLRFRHPLVRAAAYWLSGPGWRLTAHARAADYLRRQQGSLQLLAHHTERSAGHGDQRAVAILTEAGMAALHTAPATAARLLRAALRLLPDCPETAGRRADLKLALARALGVAGRLRESHDLLQEIMRDPGPRRVEAAAFASVVCRLLGQFDEAGALLSAEVARSSGRGRRTRHALVELAAVELARMRPNSARAYASRALDVVASEDDPALECAAHALLALSHLRRGETADAARHADRSTRLLDSTSDAIVLPYIEAVAPLAWVETHLQRYEHAARHIRRGSEIAERNGRSHSTPYLLIVSALSHQRQGQIGAAIAAATEAQEASRIIRSPETSSMATALLLRPVLWRDGPQAALDLAGALVAMTGPRSGWWCDLARVDLAMVYLAAGRAETCLATLGQGQPDSDPARPDSDGAGVAAYRLALEATATAELGLLTSAKDLADRAVAAAHRTGLSHQLGIAYQARAQVGGRTGSWDEAVTDVTTATSYLADANARADEATARHLSAVLHARAGRPEPAATELVMAKRLYGACEMAWCSADLARDERRLSASRPRRSGSRPGPAVGGALATLTERERQVAELAGAGLTNREIAERLYLSHKTVEAHISRAYTKLGIHSRVALARRLAAGETG